MNPLQYTSEEMFSSTELIRKSKMIFDKLHKKDIEKAIILRDGKPNFMLLDFAVYEKIMAEYLSLKELLDNHEVKTDKLQTTNKIIEKVEEVSKDEEIKEKEHIEADEINEIDLEKALAQIDDLDLEDLSTNLDEENPNLANNEKTKAEQKDEKELLKEFWE